MGAEFILYALPACEMTAQRAEVLKQQLAALPDEDLAEIACDYGETDDARDRVRQAIDFLLVAGGQRDVSDFYLGGMPYPLLVTGGLSWGDFPTDAACEFSLISGCSRLYVQLEEWARQDMASAPANASDSTLS